MRENQRKTRVMIAITTRLLDDAASSRECRVVARARAGCPVSDPCVDALVAS